ILLTMPNTMCQKRMQRKDIRLLVGLELRFYMAQKTYYQKNKKKLLKQVSEYKKKNRDKYRFYTLRSRTVKITFEQYKAIYSNNPKCYICSRKQTSKKLCIDHDHKTGKVRGLLCNKCNRALGLFQDSSKL